tara:strand:- start:275 stop:736 length:462 start_codon:yes stop_codon:yes gene_type:complete
MFKTEIKGNSLYINLTPNNSSSLNENFVFFGFLSLICLTFGIGFFFVGATMILPFAGLEVLALILILRINRNWLNQKQVICLDKLYVKIIKDNKEMVFDRFLSKFLIEENNSKKSIYLKCNEEKIEIGSFLNEDEKKELIDVLKKKISNLNFS